MPIFAFYSSLLVAIAMSWSTTSAQSPGANSSLPTQRTISFQEEQPVGTFVTRLSELLLQELQLRALPPSTLLSRNTTSPTPKLFKPRGSETDQERVAGPGSGPGPGPGPAPGPGPSPGPGSDPDIFSDAELAGHVVLVRPTQYLALDNGGSLRTAVRVDREALCSQGVRICCCPAPGSTDRQRAREGHEQRTAGGPERQRETASGSSANAKGAFYFTMPFH